MESMTQKKKLKRGKGSWRAGKNDVTKPSGRGYKNDKKSKYLKLLHLQVSALSATVFWVLAGHV